MGRKVKRKKVSEKKDTDKKIAAQERGAEGRPDKGSGILDFWFFIRPHKASQAKERTKEKNRAKALLQTID